MKRKTLGFNATIHNFSNRQDFLMKTDKIIGTFEVEKPFDTRDCRKQHYLTIRPLESVKAYNRQLEAELSAVERIIKGELT